MNLSKHFILEEPITGKELMEALAHITGDKYYQINIRNAVNRYRIGQISPKQFEDCLVYIDESIDTMINPEKTYTRITLAHHKNSA